MGKLAIFNSYVKLPEGNIQLWLYIQIQQELHPKVPVVVVKRGHQKLPVLDDGPI